MKVVVIIEEGMLFSSTMTQDILTRLGEEVVCVITVDSTANSRLRNNIFKYWKYIGALTLLKLVIVVGTRRVLKHFPLWIKGSDFATVKELAKKNHLPHKTVNKLAEPGVIQYLGGFDADVFVTSVNEILTPEFLSLPHKCCLNKHASLLPSYKGIMPVFQALAHGEKKVGITIHEMNEKIDEGRILCQMSETVLPGDTVWTLSRRVYSNAGAAIEYALNVLRGDCDPKLEMPAPQENYFSYPTESSWKELASRKLKFI